MWLNSEVSFYETHTDVIGKPLTLRQIILSKFSDYLPVLMQLKKTDADEVKKSLKSQLGCYALNLLETRTGNVLNRTGLMQFDIDNITDYDIEELKQALFSYPFVALVSLSCSGKGLFVLAMIAEPEKLKQYAEHCFKIFADSGLPIDTSKGRKVNDLRYVSYDCNMLIRENPVPLKVQKFYTPPPAKPKQNFTSTNTSGLIRWAVNEIQAAQVGQRFPTVQRVAYAMGGHNTGLDEILNTISNTSQYHGVESKYLKCARDCFRDGTQKPML